MFGIGKPRTRLGEWLDNRGIRQDWLVKKSKLHKTTVSALCGDSDYSPSLTTIQKIIKALKEIDPNVNGSKFWDI
jgi:DNA-binding XRE family transcriptional regulator